MGALSGGQVFSQGVGDGGEGIVAALIHDAVDAYEHGSAVGPALAAVAVAMIALT
jgi:hypothetical protein